MFVLIQVTSINWQTLSIYTQKQIVLPFSYTKKSGDKLRFCLLLTILVFQVAWLFLLILEILADTNRHQSHLDINLQSVDNVRYAVYYIQRTLTLLKNEKAY